MKFTAEFESTDTADTCAAAIKSKISGVSSINIKNGIPFHSRRNVHIYPLYDTSIMNPMLPFPVYNPVFLTRDINAGLDADVERSRPVLEVVCRKEDAKTVSGIIIGYNGQNIHKIVNS